VVQLDKKTKYILVGLFSTFIAIAFLLVVYVMPSRARAYAVPTIESCNQVGDQVDSFELGETVHVTGSNYSQSTTCNVSIVVDVENWTEGMAIPERVPSSATTVASDMNGDVTPTAIWTTQTVGKFDIVVDVNGNGLYDPGIDALDDNDIEVTAGFSVMPELSSSLLLALFMIATLLMIAVSKRVR
jgi:hypothetical protein